MRFLTLLLLGFFVQSGFAQLTLDDIYKQNRTYTHKQVIFKYARLVKDHPGNCQLIKYGLTDCGRHLHLFVINKKGVFDPSKLDRSKTNVLLVNNAIHPGEPCGVDACVRLSRELLAKPELIPDNLTIAIIPMYNVGGATNRSCCSRANQNGPMEYGFRGNARNLDLNRDFVKCDSRNAWSFVEMFRLWDPDIFVDTHTSNGADYQHVMTLITTQTDKLNSHLSELVVNDMRPHLFDQMKESGYPMVPYMHTVKSTPDDGIKDYNETPRYSTGYAAVFNSIGFVSEAHMLKPFEQRVESTYEFLRILVEYSNKNADKIYMAREQAKQATRDMVKLDLNYELDTNKYDEVPFMGYEATKKPSEISGLDRLYYDRDKPYTKNIRYYRYYNPTLSIAKPKNYVIPQSWREVIGLLEHNGVEMDRLEYDTTMVLNAYYIQSYETTKSPYEGHYLHYNTEVEERVVPVRLYKGDYVVKLGRDYDRFVMEVLEPHSVDSYFAWNYFDEILMQKEWFSSYVFEDRALELLNEDPALKKQLEAKKAEDPEFAQNGRAQLHFVYTHSPYYEQSHMRYPVYRVTE